jgi:hypothetical protein
MRIKIIGTTPGDNPPKWVKDAWVGIELESMGKETTSPQNDFEVLTGMRNSGGYMVAGYLALEALKNHNKKAYDWWQKNCPLTMTGILVFHTSVCKEIIK